jgi:ParB-like chromosome segregation protein Spo0J
MTDLSVKYSLTAELTPYINNSRTHSDTQLQQIAASIEEFGFTNPILIDQDGGVIAGHGRLLAAELLNLDKVPTIIIKGLTEAQKKAYVIADNKLALNSGWDDELLKIELDSLTDLDFDLDVLGWDVLPSFEEEIDYSVLDDQSAVDNSITQEVVDMSTSVKRAIMIEFESEHYDDARELVDYWRKQGADIGYMFLCHMKTEKSKQDSL